MTPADVTNPDADAGDTGPRCSKNVVYTRKPKNPVPPVVDDVIPSPAAPPHLTSSTPPPPTVATSPLPPVLPPSRSKNKNRKLSIHIRSLTRAERSQLRRKLNAELALVRAMIRRAEELLGTPTEPKNSQRPVVKYAHAFRSCQLLLSKLMKQRNAPIFNSPVDVEGLGLHDYFAFIREPMDLGTVKTRLSKNLYATPGEFARDVRLTFTNAMQYNGEGHEVHSFAERLSKFFEERWAKINADLRKTTDMTPAEKKRLKGKLEELPQDVKHRALLLIIRKKNPNVNPDDDIKLDLETMDAETLWELHRYVSNYSKNAGKRKRKDAKLAKQKAAQRRIQNTDCEPAVVEQSSMDEPACPNLQVATPVTALEKSQSEAALQVEYLEASEAEQRTIQATVFKPAVVKQSSVDDRATAATAIDRSQNGAVPHVENREASEALETPRSNKPENPVELTSPGISSSDSESSSSGSSSSDSDSDSSSDSK